MNLDHKMRPKFSRFILQAPIIFLLLVLHISAYSEGNNCFLSYDQITLEENVLTFSSDCYRLPTSLFENIIGIEKKIDTDYMMWKRPFYLSAYNTDTKQLDQIKISRYANVMSISQSGNTNLYKIDLATHKVLNSLFYELLKHSEPIK